jgi:hypothetical protein
MPQSSFAFCPSLLRRAKRLPSLATRLGSARHQRGVRSFTFHGHAPGGGAWRALETGVEYRNVVPGDLVVVRDKRHALELRLRNE